MIECPICGSTNVQKYGLYKWKDKILQRYLCNEGHKRAYFNEESSADPELVSENVRYKKQTQKFQDTNRVERKAFRENARIENAVEEYTKKLITVFDKNKISISSINHDVELGSVGIFQISDTHFNELVDIENNRYDFTVASKRLQKYVYKAKMYFKANGIKTVLIAMTADILNSDRRLDELLSNATNRSKATFLAVQLLENVIFDLNLEFNILIASVTGNESRVGKDIGWQDQVASDNYDLTIYRILEYHLKDKHGITFIGGDSLTKVVNILGFNWLLIHGHQNGFNGSVTQTISKLCRLYSDKGINIRFVIFGHIHEGMIADMYARSSSLVGPNSYSENALLLTSRASQNIHVQFEDGNIDSIKIDLQTFEGFYGYPVQKELEEYNAKSASKVYSGDIIYKIII